MPDYIKTGPFANGSSPGISATFLNNIENVFVQPSGGTETGAYWFELAAYNATANEGVWINTLSRGTTMVSASIDTSITAATGFNAPTTATLNANGFWIGASSTGASDTCRVGGLWTAQY